MIISLEDQIRGMKGAELKEYIKSKYNHYKSSPEGCVDYIQECLYVGIPGVGYKPFELWDTQKRMIIDIVENMFDNRKDMYILLGSRQCGKTTCTTAICDWLTTFYQKYNVVLIHLDDTRGKGQCEEFRKMREEKTRLMYLPTKKNALTHQIFQNDSSFRLQSAQKSKTGKDADTGRGLSVNLLWVDEAGGVDLDKLESSIFPTTSTTFIFCKENNIPHIILLSGTANGRVGIGKRFYDLWKQVEPPKNKTNPSMGGYLLFWKDIPSKDQTWYDSWSQILPARKINQEIGCVFLGTDSALFTDDQIAKIQAYSNQLINKEIPTNYTYTCPSGHIARGTFYRTLIKGNNYLIGVDMAKGRNQDYSVIEILDYDTLGQVFELTDNKIQHDDFVKLLNNIVLTFLNNQCNVCISIESNMTGSAVINDLIALNSIYKMLIYRNTIGADISKLSQSKTIEYNDCRHGVEITNATRDLLINYIFTYVDKYLYGIRSKYLLNEIESLEINKDGRIEGVPHDDSVFALGHCLLLKFRGRIRNILSIFRSCEDIRNDPMYAQYIYLSLNNYDTKKIQSALDNNDNILYNRVGVIEGAIYNNPEGYGTITDSSNADIIDPETLNNFFTPTSIELDSNGQVDANSLATIRESLMVQTEAIKARIQQQHQEEANSFMKKINKKVSKKISSNTEDDIHIFSNDYHGQFNDSKDPMDCWIGSVIP